MPSDSTSRRLRALIPRFPTPRILVIGDVTLDEFIWGKVSRISPAAPGPIVNLILRGL